MKISELKALSRERLLGKYGTICIAVLLRRALISVCVLLSSVFAALGVLNAGIGAVAARFLPHFSGSRPSAVIFLFLAAAGFAFSLILSLWTGYGITRMMLKTGKDRRVCAADILFMFRKEARPWKVLGTAVLKNVFVLLNAVIPFLVYACARICGTDVLAGRFESVWHIAFSAVTLLSILWAVYLDFAFAFAKLCMIEHPELEITDALRMSMKATRGRKLKLFWLTNLSFLFWMIPLVIVPVSAIWIGPYFGLTYVLFYLDGIKGPVSEDTLPIMNSGENAGQEAEPAAEFSEAAKESTQPVPSAAEEPAQIEQPEVPETLPDAYDEEKDPVPDLENKTRKIVNFPDIDAEPESHKEEQKS